KITGSRLPKPHTGSRSRRRRRGTSEPRVAQRTLGRQGERASPIPGKAPEPHRGSTLRPRGGTPVGFVGPALIATQGAPPATLGSDVGRPRRPGAWGRDPTDQATPSDRAVTSGTDSKPARIPDRTPPEPGDGESNMARAPKQGASVSRAFQPDVFSRGTP